jgi:hypothetical protein
VAALSSIALIGGLALSGAGVGAQVFGAIHANEAQKDEIRAQQKAEASREQGMKLDAMRKQREAIRQGMLARSQALTVGSNQGAGYGSGITGAEAGATQQSAYNVLGVSEQSQIGSQIFQANREAFNAKKEQADAGTLSAIGGGLGTLGGALMKNVGQINRLGSSFGSNYLSGT